MVACLTSQQHASASQTRICSDMFTFCNTEIQVADQTFCLTQPQYTNTETTSLSTGPIMPGARLGSHWCGSWRRQPRVGCTGGVSLMAYAPHGANNNNHNNNNSNCNDDNHHHRHHHHHHHHHHIQRRNSRFLQSPHCAVNHLQHVRSSGPGTIMCKSHATHRALITCNMSCYMPRGMQGQLSY